MNAAIQKAQETLPGFLDALRKRASPNCQYFVKAKFREGDASEHMWLTELTVDGNCIHGIVANHPQLLRRPRYRQKVTVIHPQISDWMIDEAGQVEGAFTVEVLNREA